MLTLHLRLPLRVSCRSSASRSDAWLPLPGAPSSSGVAGRFSWSVLLEREASDTLYVPSVVFGEFLQRLYRGLERLGVGHAGMRVKTGVPR